MGLPVNTAENGAFKMPRAVQDQGGQKVHCPHPHRHEPEDQGEPEEILQGQEVPALGPPPEEDPCPPPRSDPRGEEHHLQERDEEEVGLPYQTLCCQGVNKSNVK